MSTSEPNQSPKKPAASPSPPNPWAESPPAAPPTVPSTGPGASSPPPATPAALFRSNPPSAGSPTSASGGPAPVTPTRPATPSGAPSGPAASSTSTLARPGSTAIRPASPPISKLPPVAKPPVRRPPPRPKAAPPPRKPSGSGLAVTFYPDIVHATNASQFLVNSGAQEWSENPTVQIVKLTSSSVSVGQTVVIRDTVASATYNSSSGTTQLTFQSINSQPSGSRSALASLAQDLFGTISGQVSWIGSGTAVVMSFTVVQA